MTGSGVSNDRQPMTDEVWAAANMPEFTRQRGALTQIGVLSRVIGRNAPDLSEDSRPETHTIGAEVTASLATATTELPVVTLNLQCRAILGTFDNASALFQVQPLNPAVDPATLTPFERLGGQQVIAHESNIGDIPGVPPSVVAGLIEHYFEEHINAGGGIRVYTPLEPTEAALLPSQAWWILPPESR